MNFVKLNNQFNITGIIDQEQFRSYGRVREGRFRGVRYSTVLINEEQQLFNIIPERYRSDFVLAVMRINITVPPHTDSNIKGTINFYVDTHMCVTQFWKVTTNNPNTFKIANQTNGSMIDPNHLEKVDSFIAEPSDGYLLNVSQPHSVYPIVGDHDQFNKERVAVSLQCRKYTFEQMYEMLQETGSI